VIHAAAPGAAMDEPPIRMTRTPPDAIAYRPRQRAGRFSANARTPSRRSSE
jgi:hypothetical protein